MKLKLWGTVKTESGNRWDSMKTEKVAMPHTNTHIYQDTNNAMTGISTLIRNREPLESRNFL